MSMITSCPACGTMFRVVPDQLKISEGWVRCGHCAEIFDASAHLGDESILDIPVAEQAPRPPPAAPIRQPEPPTMPAELQTRPAGLHYPSEVRAAAAAAAAEAASDRSSEPSDFFGSDSQALEPSPLDTPFVFRPSDMVRDNDSSLGLDDPRREVQILPRDEEEDDEPERALRNVSFVRNARRKAFWRRPMVRITGAFLSLLLAALLVLQFAYQDRDRLALMEPALRPALERMCDFLACRIGPPRQIEAIVVESSGFNRLRNDTYRLSFTLRNTGRVQVAAPAVELTITDAQDQPLARRVIAPTELGFGEPVIPAGGDWSRAAGLVITTPSQGRVAGYRLLAFYP
jgi:predicted Zn finger-like uncharacterized protein